MLYETYIAKSRYARYLDAQSRRENWHETVQRYVDFMSAHLLAKHNYTMPAKLAKEIHDAIERQEVMPSMRALMTAGKALQRDNTAGYNCSYLPIDDPKAFDEAMYILLCFAPETLVQLRDGVKKPISELTTDDEVLSYSEQDKAFSYIRPEAVFETPSADMKKFEITFDDGSIVKTTFNHPFLTSNRGWVNAEDLTDTDDIIQYE